MLVKCYFFKSERGLESLSRGYAPALGGLESCLVSATFEAHKGCIRSSGSNRQVAMCGQRCTQRACSEKLLMQHTFAALAHRNLLRALAPAEQLALSTWAEHLRRATLV